MKVKHLFEMAQKSIPFIVNDGDIDRLGADWRDPDTRDGRKAISAWKKSLKPVGELDGLHMVANRGFRFIGVMNSENGLVAGITGHFYKDEREYEVTLMMVTESYRGKNLAARLLQHIIDNRITVRSSSDITLEGIRTFYSAYKNPANETSIKAPEAEFYALQPGLTLDQFSKRVYGDNRTEIFLKKHQ